MNPRAPELALHLVRLGASAAALGLASHLQSLPGAVAAGGALFFESFSFMHDLAHGALHLPRRANEVALSLAGVAMLKSAHAMRRMHLAHHAHPGAAGDVEGAPANQSFLRALLTAPAHAVALRLAAHRLSGPRGRRIQLVETAASLLLAALLLASRDLALVAYVAVAAVGSLSMGVWASHVPHRRPGWLVALARRLSFSRSPTILALAYHDLHHAHPEVPTVRLHEVARGVA